MDFKKYFDKNGLVKFKICVEVFGEGEGYVLVWLKVDFFCCEGDEYVLNICIVYEQD